MHSMMYLAPKHWSPRYDDAFFTVKIVGRQKMTSSPLSNDQGIGGKTHHPAVYYEVQVLRAQEIFTIYRRYSNFKWLYEQITKFPPSPEEENNNTLDDAPIEMPSGTCLFQPQDEEFLQQRMEDLAEFVNNVLERPGYACHPSVSKFFQLHEFGLPMK
mmetsp:Transcript_3832/g.5536  ORF Transcript_3832/g.5536 Transcript_3832/m.5536 type:complete len:158 (+) Transcript_3832:194-667(+)